jgi:hypothetical protein
MNPTGSPDDNRFVAVPLKRWQWLPAWVGGAVIGVVNGVARDATYGRRLPPARANQLSALTAVLLFAHYFEALERRWPITTEREARILGGAWLALTVSFEFSFGRLMAKKSWDELTDDYDIRRGRLWPLVLASIALGPEIARRRASA